MQIALQTFGRSQAIKDMSLLFSTEIRRGTDRFQFFLQPALFGRVADVHEFGTDRAAIGIAQRVQQIAQGGRFGTKISVADIEHGFHVGIAEAVETGFQLRNAGAFLALQRVQVGPVTAEETVGGDQLRNGNALAPHLDFAGCADGADRTLLGALGERSDHGSMNDVRPVRAIDGRNVLHRVEIGAPVVWYRAGIVEVRLVQFFNVRCIAPKQIRVGAVLLHHFAHLSSRFARLAG